jgi:predicted nucleic acid-binding protein
VTHPRIFRLPSTLDQCLEEIRNWRARPTFRCIAEGGAYWPNPEKMLVEGRVQGPLVHNARIAAVCVEHGVREFWTIDRDFSRFPPLPVVNPLSRICI